ncbi:MAG: EVE domain-containing protein [Pseudomonadota bacterium]|nr:EVE domain-containing protein [Pseudomonadota bacterium]
MRYWLMKSEPHDVSIDDLAARPTHPVAWTGVRNYQARNFMRDQMTIGDLALFYHSGCKEIGVVGVAEIVSNAYPDPTQFVPDTYYYDPKATQETPRWVSVDIRFVSKGTYVPLSALRAEPDLAELRILAKGSRLSITPVERADFRLIETMLKT